MGGRVAFLVLLCGCKQLLGFDSPTPLAADDDAAVDMPLVDMPIDVPADLPLQQNQVTFQQNNLYTGTIDTHIGEGDSGNNANDAQLRWRDSDRHALVQFTEIFGAGAGQIPPGSTIVSAQLDVNCNQHNSNGTFYELTVAWADTVTFATLGPDPGITTDLGVVVGGGPTITGPFSIDVTASLVKWSSDPSKNHGWILVGDAGNADSSFRSSEDGIPANRPTLIVTYLQ